MQLYQRLKAAVPKTGSVSVEEWITYAAKTTTLSNSNAELLYALILHHYFLTTGEYDSLPYGIKKLSAVGGVGIPISGLPSELQQIVVLFLNEV
jgi:hypothetical protein